MDRNKPGAPKSDRDALHQRISKKEIDAALAVLKEKGRELPPPPVYETPEPLISTEHLMWLTREEAALKEAVRIVKVARGSLGSIESLLSGQGMNVPNIQNRYHLSEPRVREDKVRAEEELARSIHHLTQMKTELQAYIAQINTTVNASFQNGTQHTKESRSAAAWLVKLRQLQENIEIAENNPF